MKIQLSLIFTLFLVFSCSEKSEEIINNEEITKIENPFLIVSDSLDKTANLTHYQYQNLTVWGGIEAWYLDNEIVKIRATERGELGYIRTTHFFENSSSFKSEQINRTPNWKEFEEKYGATDLVGDERMTFVDDTTLTIANQLDSFNLQMIKEAAEIFIFISNENIINP